MNNKNNNTLIVGASGAFGQIITEHRYKKGDNLILTHSGKDSYQLPAGIKGQVLELDVTDADEIDSVIGKCEKVNNLFYLVGAPIKFRKFEEEEWREYEIQWQTQVKGLWHIIQSLIKHKHPLRYIALLGSAVTDKPTPRLGAYITAKYALLGLLESLKLQLALYKIDVEMVSPNATGDGLSKEFPRLMLEMEKTQSKKLVTAEDAASRFDDSIDRINKNQ